MSGPSLFSKVLKSKIKKLDRTRAMLEEKLIDHVADFEGVKILIKAKGCEQSLEATEVKDYPLETAGRRTALKSHAVQLIRICGRF